MQTSYDVIVIGGGGSGLAAAVSAAEKGADVLLIEKRAQLGGTTGIAVGSFTAARTRIQRSAGITDEPEHHREDAACFAPSDIEARNNEELRRFFLSQAAGTLHWLMEMGLTFQGPNPDPPNRVPRMHNVVPGAKAYIATLQARLLKLGGTVQVEAPVSELIRREGNVAGVVAEIGGETVSFTARRGVILASGDYANAPELIARFKGDRFSAIEGINPNADGSGHHLLESVHARLLNMDVTYGPELRFVPPPGKTFQQLLPASGPLARLMGKLLPLVPRFIVQALTRRLLVTWQHPENALFDDGAILINSEGRRFCEETVWPDREIAVAAQPDKRCYFLLDERLIHLYSAWPHFISTAPKVAYAYVADYAKLRPDITALGSTLQELAAKRGLPADVLARTVEEANRDRTSESSVLEAGLPPLTGKRWCLLGPACAYFTTTEGGAAIDREFHVLDENGVPIPGLFAVGQVGLGGQILWGHGLHIAWAMTSGRLAGMHVASHGRIV